jgi:predicted Zn-dependent protease
MESQMPSQLFVKSLKLFGSAALVAGMLAAAPVYAVDGGGGGSSDYSSSDSSGSSAVSGPSLNDARALIRAKKWKSAVTTLKQIVRANPGNAEANNLLGYSLRKTGDYKNAQGFYLKALKLNPGHKGANEYLGELYVEIGQMAKAKKQLARLEQLCGNTSCSEYKTLAKFIASKG